MSQPPICPCDIFNHPQVISNPPGQGSIAYRIGDYATFRKALLLALLEENGDVREQELTSWRPTARGDLALQLVDWWAYLSDILTFYNERIANQSYLQTADLPENLNRLIRTLGYRPRPGIGAQGNVSALTTGTTAFTVPRGFQIQSKPGPGKQPQIFEVHADTTIKPELVPAGGAQRIPTGAIAVKAPEPPKLLDSSNSILLEGKVKAVKEGDNLLLIQKSWNPSDGHYTWVKVQSVCPEPKDDSETKVNTRITFTQKPTLPDNAWLPDYQVLRSVQFTYLWPYPTAASVVVIESESAHLDAVIRQIEVGDLVLFELEGKLPELVRATSYSEVVWYANSSSNPQNPTGDIPVPIPHTLVSFPSNVNLNINWNSQKNSVVVRYDWQEVGKLIPTPLKTFSEKEIVLSEAPSQVLPAGTALTVSIEDANGKGVEARVSSSGSPSDWVATQLSDPPLPLKSPLSVLFHQLFVSRGETVPAEILGSGDASIAGQEFVLQKSPLTYLLSGDQTSAAPYKSTLRVWVKGVEWKEVPSFYGQSPDAHIFVTREDEDRKTHVLFGDGVYGARLPSGIDNVKASYRYGSGAEAPDTGSLTVMVKPHPNLKSIRNPVPVGGGADPDSPQHIRRYAPQSVLTFNRAVSARDYEAIAAQSPGVARVRAYWSWDAQAQQSLVKIYVGDDASAVNSAKVALSRASDPNRPVKIERATVIPIQLSLTLRIASSYDPAPVVNAARKALIDPDTGLLGTNNIQIGQSIYQSQIHAACMNVSGVLAVRAIQLSAGSVPLSGYRFDPGEGGFYQLQDDNLDIFWEVG